MQVIGLDGSMINSLEALGKDVFCPWHVAHVAPVAPVAWLHCCVCV